MMIQTNTTDRKALARAIAGELHTEACYMRAPTYAYEVGDFKVDRDGNIVGDDFTPLMGFLLRNGYITEEALAAQVGTAEAPTEPARDAEAPAEGVAPDEDAAGEADAEGADPDSGEEQQTDAPVTTNTIDEQTITIPARDITVEQLKNLTYILYSRQYILNLMTSGATAPSGDTISIPVELVEALKEALPATPGDFTALLDSHRELGLKGFDFRDGQFSLTFPFYETEPTKWTAFAGLQGRILQMAMAATRVFPELIRPGEDAEKYTAHMWLQRMGYRGPEMKEQRNILLKHLHGYCAFSNADKMQKHKDRFSAIRRERREAEHAAAAEATSETTSATTATAPSVVAHDEEVAANE